MNLESIRRILRLFLGLEHRDTTAKFLYAILISGLTVDLALIVLRLLNRVVPDSTFWLFIALLGFQIILLFMARRGYVDLAALSLVMGCWACVTYQLWNAYGVHDVAIYGYIIIFFMAALLVNWRISIVLSILSVVAIWVFAIAEAKDLRAATVDSPINIAADLTIIFPLMVFLIYLLINTVRHSIDAVRANEEKFRKVFHVSPVAIGISSLEEGRLLDANEAYWKLIGLDRTQAIGKTTIELGLWNSYSERLGFVKELKTRKSLHDSASEIRRKSGEYRTTLAFYELIDFENRPAILAMYYDITEQKKAELALQASEQKYRNFIEQSMEGIWFVAFEHPILTSLPAEEQAELIFRRGYIAECNDTLARLYGYNSSAELIGMPILDLAAGGEINPTNYQAMITLIKKGYRGTSTETRERTRAGRSVYFLNSAVGVVQDDYLIGLWGTHLDITALKSAEDALRRSEARMRALLDAVPDMIFEIDRAGAILQYISSTANDAPTPILPPEQFIGRSIRDVLPSIADQTFFAIERVLESGRVYAFEYQLPYGNENKTFEARITYLSANTVFAIVRDISLQKWIQSEREDLITELERKNAELERFTYTVSHDLKSPLITIKGFLGFLRDDARAENFKRLDSDAQRIGDAADKMERLLNDLLELSRIGRLVNESRLIDFNEMISEVLELLHGRLHGGDICVKVAENLPQIYGDRPRLFEVLQNLIDNAAKFMGDQPNPCIEIGQDGTDGGAPIFFVRDNGVGIDPRFKDRIFGLFDKLDPHTDGTGIGLALVKRIIEIHGGRIWVESEPGKGATFYFTLPQREPSV